MSVLARQSESPVYTLVRSASKVLFEGCWRAEFAGLHNIPEEGGFMIASNHASYLDPPLMGYRVRRPIYYFARKTLLDNPISKRLLPAINTIPVDRDGPSDIQAMKTILRLLGAGNGMLIFPEGTRTIDARLQPAKPGIGMLACKANVPVVPARCWGTFEALGRQTKHPNLDRPLSVRYGKPLVPCDLFPDVKSKKERYELVSKKIMDEIAALTPPRRPVY